MVEGGDGGGLGPGGEAGRVGEFHAEHGLVDFGGVGDGHVGLGIVGHFVAGPVERVPEYGSGGLGVPAGKPAVLEIILGGP